MKRMNCQFETTSNFDRNRSSSQNSVRLTRLFFLFAVTISFVIGKVTLADPSISSVPIDAVQISSPFWTQRIELNRKVTVWSNLRKCEETGRLRNFAKAAGRLEGEFEGIRYNDSDVFKVIEGISYSLATHPDSKLEKRLDQLIDDIAAAQEDDGYLFTARTIQDDRVDDASGKTRWSHLAHSHELYNLGHLYEAAVAHFQATGKRSLLDVAIRSADLVDREFGPHEGQRRDVPGHQEIELGLIRLYRVTGEQRYVDLAKFFLDLRGQKNQRTQLYGKYHQDHLPVVEQTTAVGHAVRAVYMYAAMAEIAAMSGDKEYGQAVDRVWEDVVSSKLYLTGGIGARREGEAFGEKYELPNASAYNETCAAIALALWNQRMFLLRGEGKYFDVLERVLYNGFLSGVSLEGDQFFYPNPLSTNGIEKFNQGVFGRSPWFDCSCCPVNVVRFVPSIAGQVYASGKNRLYVNLFVSSTATIDLDGEPVEIAQETDYPWDGDIAIQVNTDEERQFALQVRVPGWTREQPVPSDLYSYVSANLEPYSIRVNGQGFPAELKQGYAVIDRVWKPYDLVELQLPMPVRRVIANEKVSADRGRVALERGPIVYCLEGVDHDGKVSNLVLHDNAKLIANHRPDLLDGMTVVEAEALVLGEDSKPTEQPKHLTAVPYYSWNHRGAGEMAVWMLRQERE